MLSQGIMYRVCEELLNVVSDYYESGEYIKPFRSKDLADCVLQHSAAVGVASMAAGVLPLAGAVVAMGAGTVAIWKMYVKICSIIGVPFGKNKLKALASAALTNIVTQLAGIYAFQIASSIIPGMGIISCGVIDFASTYIAGLLFLMVLTRLFKTGRNDVENMSDEELIDTVKSAMASIDMKMIFKEAKNIFMDMRRDGSLEQMGAEADISDEEETAEMSCEPKSEVK